MPEVLGGLGAAMTRLSGHWSDSLVALGVCPDAVKWVRAQESLIAAWAACERGDWMLWLIGKMTVGLPWSDARKPLVRAACACARLALTHTTDARVLAAITTAEEWCEGKATPAEVRAAAETADAADDDAADAYAAYAAEGADTARIAILKTASVIVREYFPRPPESHHMGSEP